MTTDTARPKIAGLADGHLEDLLRSGLVSETILGSQIYSASGPEASAIVGYGVGPGMVIPYPSVNGGPAYARVKLDHAGPDGKRYRSPKGRGNHLYIPPTLASSLLTDPEQPLFVTEGEKKCLRAVQDGLLCLALSGVWSWRQKGPDGLSRPIPDLDLIPWTGRAVYIVFDSDLATNPDVQAAEGALAHELARRGATVHAIRLPPGPGDAKVGLDDYLLVHSVETFCQIPSVPLAAPPTAAAPEPVELTALLDRTYPDDPGLVAGGLVVRRGLVVVGGGPKIGKTVLVSNLVLARAQRRPWLGYATTPGVSLVAQAEIPEPELQKRVGLQIKDTGRPPAGSVYFLTDRRIKLDRPDGLARLRALLDQVRPDLLVIDPLARFFSGDENSAKDMGALVAALDTLIQDYALTIIIVHHTGKGSLEPREGGQRLRGSSALFGAADTVMLLDRDGEGFKLSFELRHGEEPAPLYLTRTKTLWFVPAGPPEELLAVAYLVHSGPLRWGQLITAIRQDRSVPKRTAERLLDRAKKADLIAADADGYYTATATYRHARSGGESSAR